MDFNVLVFRCFSFLTARAQCVSFNKSISPFTYIERGIPQCSVLGSLLFSRSINDHPMSVLHRTCDMFADDTCIHVSDACYGNVLSTLQLSTDEVCNWATNNFMTIDPQKINNHDYYSVAKTSSPYLIHLTLRTCQSHTIFRYFRYY